MEENTSVNLENSHAFFIKADETFVTARPRYDAKEDSVQGLYSSHGIEHLKFKTFEEAEKLCEANSNIFTDLYSALLSNPINKKVIKRYLWIKLITL